MGRELTERRDDLVRTALELFSQSGYHATGIDAILDRSGVAKGTLYKHFRSKDELIVAALRLQDQLFRAWLTLHVDGASDSPAERLVALFEANEEWVVMTQFRGCAFIHASAEYSDPRHPVHAAALEHKQYLLGYVRGLATAAGVEAPDRLASQLILLVEGAFVRSQMTGAVDAASEAKEAARVLIETALASNTR